MAVNDAYLDFTGRTRDALIGTDPVLLQPLEDQATQVESRRELPSLLAAQPVPRLSEQRLIDASGRERWSRASAYPVLAQDGLPLLLCVLQDSTAEHVARAQADRSLNELAQWFDLSPTGMLVFDEAGLIVRSNPAFEALVGQVPVMLNEASSELQTLLAWRQGAPRPELQPGAAPLEMHVVLALPDGRRQRLSARVRGFATDQGQLRFMAVVEDRSAEEERDLAQLEIGALMDTAGVGVATFDSARGWLRPRAERRRAAAKSAGLQSIARDIVEPDSLPEYERLQQALRRGERTEVRYAVNHAELGRRWLLTRVEPGEGDSGRRTVVTVDVTEQESAQRQSQQLLRELTTILDGTTAGIAYLRGAMLVRCNRRFEAMLGLEAGAAAGATINELFGRFPQALAALQSGSSFETELSLPPSWYSLSVRRAEPAAGDHEVVAVLTDISRLKSQQTELEALLRDRELMFSLSDVGIAYLRGARIERANQAMAALTGYADSELGNLDPAELALDAEDHRRHEQEELRMLRQQGRYHGERQLRRRDGSLVWVQVAQRLVDEADESAGRICSYVDVQERHRAREELLRQAERTRAILDSVLVGIVTVSDSGIEWMNRSARRMFGGELADFVGEPIATVATPEPEHPLRRTDYPDTLAEGQAQTFECRLKARDGREFWVVGNAVLTGRGSSGRQVTFALLDIERRRQAEISIAQAQASLQRIIETAPLAIALFDARSQRVLQANQMAAAFFDRPAEALVGGTPHDWFSGAAAEGPVGGPAQRRCVQRGAAPRTAAGRRGRPADLGHPPDVLAHQRRCERAVAAGGQRRDRAAGRGRTALRGGDRAARDAGQGSAPPHQEQPAGCGRAAAAERGAPPRAGGDAQRIGRPGAGHRAGLRAAGRRRRSAAPGRRAAGDRAVGAAHLRPSGAGAGAGRRRGRHAAARSRIDPDRADPERAADQCGQAQPAGRGALRAVARRRRTCAWPSAMPAGCARASTWRSSRAVCPAWAWCARCCRGAAPR